MARKKQSKADTIAPTPDATIGRPAFPSNLMPIGRDDAQPAGAVQMQVPLHEQKEKKPGSSTITLMNPTPIAAAPPASTIRKRG